MNRDNWMILRTMFGPAKRARESARVAPTLADLRQTIDPDLTDLGYVSLVVLRRLRPLPRLQP